MDLLQGYGSDGSSSTSSVENIGPSLSSSKTNNTTSASSFSLPNTTAVATTTTTTNNKYGRNSTTSIANKKKKGTRILKLNSVLPPEILERLTRSSVQNAGGSSGKYDTSSDDDSDSENDNPPSFTKGSIQRVEPSQRKKSIVRKRKQAGGHVDINTKKENIFSKETQKNIGGDVALDSLLSDLQSVAPTEETKKEKNRSKSDKNNDNDKLGLAFMNVSNTVIRKKQNDKNDIVDIHATTPIAGKKRTNAVIKDVSSDEEEDEKEEVDAHEKVSMFPSTESNQQKQNQSNIVSSSSRSNKGTAIKRPRSAAVPTVPSNFQTVKMPSNYMEPYQTTQMSMAPPPLQPPPSSYHQYQNEQNNQTATQRTQPTKMSKRELEKALRSGNFDAIDSSNMTQSIDSSHYMAPSQNELLATASASSQSASEYRTSNLQMYVPSEGASVGTNNVTSTQRSKHQIHSLVASARKLEADRARLGAMGIGGKKSTRTTAKKKYGW